MFSDSSPDFEPPSSRRFVSSSSKKPHVKEPPPAMISESMAGLRTDAEVRNFVNGVTRQDEVAVIEFGASWCHHCHEIFPAFYATSKQFPKLRYAVAHIDGLAEEGKHLQKTPTFTFYRNGKRVDEVTGTNMEALKDRLWLYHD